LFFCISGEEEVRQVDDAPKKDVGIAAVAARTVAEQQPFGIRAWFGADA